MGHFGRIFFCILVSYKHYYSLTEPWNKGNILTNENVENIVSCRGNYQRKCMNKGK